jgi:hypothetical protein
MKSMSCPRFKKEGYLFLSGELNGGDRKAFEAHLAECEICRRLLKEAQVSWRRMETMKTVAPGGAVRKAILKAARRPREKATFLERLSPHPRLVWSVSATVVAILLIFFLVGPLDHVRIRSVSQSSELSWNDDFFAQADWIDQEIERVHSGALLANFFSGSKSQSESDLPGSSASSDLERIREEVIDLAKTIYGI